MNLASDCWANQGNSNLMQYDFVAPGNWSRERVAAEQTAIAAALAEPDREGPAPAWLTLARRLPASLQAALITELGAGNQLAGIGSHGWPHDGSIVVTLRDRFSAARQAPPAGVTWRELNDPHYAREELSQTVDAVEYLIIA